MLTEITGEIDDNDLLSHVIALNTETAGVVNLRELADCRGITNVNLSTHGTTVSASNEQNKPGSKGVILVPEGNEIVFAMARAFQMFCESYRDEVKILQDYDEAVAWLANDDKKDIEALNEFINNV